ncbi:hypothetical protein [Streptomyces luteireticuli]|uniref:Uncharacterized protein n=2 Tax=Streptomyces luteireticuli TaxID=173858 RepID=A0ABP3IQZ5_9ACTN
MRLLPHLTKLTAPTRRCLHAAARPHDPSYRAGHDCPRLQLTLRDGTERDYLLDDPGGCPRPEAPYVAYDPYVHLAYILARQGRDADWLARFVDLPLPAAQRIAEAAALTTADV